MLLIRFITTRVSLAACVLSAPPAAAQIAAHWISPTDGNWTTSTNWTVDPSIPFNGFPNPLDRYHAWIDAVGAPYTVTIDFAIELDALSLNSVDATIHHTANQLNLNGGTLDLQAGHYLLDGGTLGNMVVSSSGGTFGLGAGDQALNGIAFDHVDLHIAGGQRLTATNQLEINGGTVYLGTGASRADLYVTGTNDLEGSGTYLLNNGLIQSNDDQLVISRFSIIRTVGGTANRLDARDMIVIRGTIAADGPGHLLDLDTDLVRVSGTGRVEAINGATIYATDLDQFDNRGSIHVGAGSTLFADRLLNTGTITADAGATLELSMLNGDASDLGSFTGAGASVWVRGGFDLAGGVFDLGGGGWRFGDQFSEASNGTITAASGGMLLGGNYEGILLDADMFLANSSGTSESGIEVTAGNSITLHRSAAAGSSSLSRFTTSALSGAGELRFEADGPISGSDSVLMGFNDALTIGADFTVQAVSADGILGGLTITNHGTVEALNTNTLVNSAFADFNNTGTLRASNAGVLDLYNVTNTGHIEANSFGAVFLSGEWSNTGTILVDNGTLRLGGQFDTAQLATLTINAGIVRINGELDATTAPLVIDGPGTWLVGGLPGENDEAAIIGTVNTLNGARLVTTDNTLFQQLTLDGRIDAIDATRIRFVGDTTLVNGAEIHFQQSFATSIRFAEVQSVVGDGALVFDTANAEAQVTMFGSGELTLGPGVTLRTGTGSGRVYGGVLNNNGAIRAEGAGRSIHLADAVNNAGLITAINGGAIELDPTELNNTGTVHLDAGALRVEGTFDLNALPDYTQANGAWIEVIGSLDLLGQTWATDGPRGGLVVGFAGDGGTVSNGTIDATGATPLFFNRGTSMFDATFLGEAVMRNGATVRLDSPDPLNGQTIRISGDTLDTLLLILNRELLADANATLLFDGPGNTGRVYLDGDGDFTLGTGVTVRATGGDVQLGRSNHQTVIEGTVRNESPGHSIWLGTQSGGQAHGTNLGLIETLPGATVAFSGNWHNHGTIRLGAADQRSLALNTLRLMSDGALEVAWNAATAPGDDVVLGASEVLDLGGTLALITADGFTPTRGDSLLLFDTFSLQGAFDSITVDGDAADAYVLVQSGRLVSLYLPLFGDATLDGTVGIDDLDLLLANWGQDVGPDAWAQGDFDGDGIVGQADLALLQGDWGASTTLFTQTVPEPGVVSTLMVVVGLIAGRRPVRFS